MYSVHHHFHITYFINGIHNAETTLPSEGLTVLESM